MLSLFTFLHQEEIPFSQFQNLNTKLPEIIHGVLAEYGIVASVKTSVLSCSLAFCVESEMKEFVLPKKVIKGPNKNAPQVAIEGFLRKYGLNLNNCELDEKNNLVFVLPETKLSANEISTRIVSEILDKTAKVFEQTMESKFLEWIRPINKISAFCNGERLGGVVKYYADDCNLKNWADYENWCKENEIVWNYENRKKHIESEIEAAAQKHGFEWKNSMVAELACLYDSPKLCVTQFPEKYLELPQEVLRLTIEKNQRYVLFYRAGKIQSTIGIIGKIHNETTTKGHVKTIRARLDDANYYIEKDLREFNSKTTEAKLESIMFHQKFGSVKKRIDEMLEIAGKLFAKNNGLMQAIAVCKNDLVCHTVQDFTELQGLMGSFYLEKLVAGKEVCKEIGEEIGEAVGQHYKPLSPNDSLPKTKMALQLSFVDKLQKINALAGVGEVPTSSRDPFAIRRDISSLIRMCRENAEIFGIEQSDGKILEFLQKLVHEKLHYFLKERF